MAPTERIDMKKGYNPPPKDKPENPYIPPGPPLIETAYKEKKRGTMTADEVILKLLSVLPDNEILHDDISWGWCWDELSDEAQEEVKKARRMALDYLRGGEG
jgi:hypothetical protein